MLQGQRPHAGHAPALQQIRNTLRAVSILMLHTMLDLLTYGAGTGLGNRSTHRTLSPISRQLSREVAARRSEPGDHTAIVRQCQRDL